MLKIPQGWNHSLLVVCVIIATGQCLLASVATAQTNTKPRPVDATSGKPVDSRLADRTAVRASLDSFAKAFEARDAKALAAHWTSEGEFANDAGVRVQGRSEIEKAFGQFFAKTAELHAELKPTSLKFLGSDAAQDEGMVTIRRGPLEAATHATYKAFLVREEGRWRIAQFQESSAVTVSVTELSWLVGEWIALEGNGVEIHTTYAWLPGKRFLQAQFSLKEKDTAIAMAGLQVIGIDPARGSLYSWTFESDGGVGETEWTRDGDHWVLQVDATLADGRALVETNILRRVDEDTITFQSVNRTIDDEPLADLPPVKVVRVKATKK